MAYVERATVIAYAYELVVGDLVVDTWAGTEREVTAVEAGTREVTVRFKGGTSETTTQQPGRQTIYEVHRHVDLVPVGPVVIQGVVVEEEATDG